MSSYWTTSIFSDAPSPDRRHEICGLYLSTQDWVDIPSDGGGSRRYRNELSKTEWEMQLVITRPFWNIGVFPARWLTFCTHSITLVCWEALSKYPMVSYIIQWYNIVLNEAIAADSGRKAVESEWEISRICLSRWNFSPMFWTDPPRHICDPTGETFCLSIW